MADKKKDIDFEGIKFTIPSSAKKLPVAAVEAWEDDRNLAFVKALIGPVAWARFLAREPDMEKFWELANFIGANYGFGSAGESSASGDSSEKTSEPSRPTSSESTDSSLPVSASA